ncbi:MAG: hypothetical protein AAF667_13065 [Pseudomonadota bacterium]
MNDRPPTHPWDMDLIDAKEWVVRTLLEAARSPEQIEVAVQLGAMVRLGWIEHIIRKQKLAFIRAQKKAHRAKALAQKARKDDR